MKAEDSNTIWQLWAKGSNRYIVVPTNAVIKKNNDAVMGAGMAKQAADEIPFIEHWLGRKLLSFGNQVFLNMDNEYFTFPTKHHWKDPADLDLIEMSAKRLAYLSHILLDDAQIFIPKVGCGNGGLNWSDVKPILQNYLRSDSFVLVY